MIIYLLGQLGLYSIEQVVAYDGRLFPLQNLALEGNLAHVEAIAQQVGERTAREGNAAELFSRSKVPHFCDDPSLAQIGHEQVETAKLGVTAKDCLDPVSLGLVDGDPSILGIVTEWGHATDPQPLTFRRRNLIPDALGGDLTLELGKRQQYVQGQPTHRCGGIKLLSDRDERHILLVE